VNDEADTQLQIEGQPTTLHTDTQVCL